MSIEGLDLDDDKNMGCHDLCSWFFPAFRDCVAEFETYNLSENCKETSVSETVQILFQKRLVQIQYSRNSVSETVQMQFLFQKRCKLRSTGCLCL